MDAWQSLQPFVQGGITSTVAESATFPFDLTKTRLQIQGQVLESRYKQIRYRGISHAVGKIVRDEGFLALYSGFGPAAFRQLIYGGLKRGLYLTFQNWSGTQGSGNNTFLQNLIFGLSSGAIATVVSNPFDILKIRMQSQGMPFKTCFNQLFCKDGPAGLYRGLSPNILRTSVLVGFTFSTYDKVKAIFLIDFEFREGILSYILASSIAAVFGSLFANPFDVVKSRMMNQRRDGIRYNNLIHCFRKTVKSEGPSALLKGYGTMLCRTVPWHIVFFLTDEYMWR